MNKSELKNLLPAYLDEIEFYHLGKTSADSDSIRLNRNENLFITPETQRQVLRGILDNFDPRRYGGVYNQQIVENISNHFDIPSNQVYCGNGSDEIIYLLCKLLLQNNKHALLLEPTFGTYEDAILASNGRIDKTRLRKDFHLDISDIQQKTHSKSVLFFIDSPNNPTGRQFSNKEIQNVLDTFPGVVVLDEAYVSFAPRSMLNLLADNENLVILRTFSKDFGFAGLRLGYAFSSSQLIQSLKKFWQPYNVTTLTQEAAIRILNNSENYQKINHEVIVERQKWFDELRSIKGVTPFPSDANFILFRVDKPAIEVFEALLARNIVVRNRSQSPLCENCLRVTIAPSPIRKTFMTALKGIMNGK